MIAVKKLAVLPLISLLGVGARRLLCLTRLLMLCLLPCVALPALPEVFDFESLRTLLARTGADGVAAVIGALPAELRSRYALVFESRSLQGASWSDPRAVLFGNDARLVITFNGAPAERGYDALETMEFAAGGRFVFREVAFVPGPDGFAVRISEPNPARCTACHGEPARPIWDSAPLWPGVYGERYGAGLSDRELAGMKGFLARQPAHPRYRHLLGAAALIERETYVATSRTRYAGGAAEPANARLSALLATYNVEAILGQLAAQPGFAAHLALLVAASDGGCGSLQEFYPDPRREAIAADYRTFAAAARAADHRQALAKASRRNGGGNARTGMASAPDPTPLRYVAERELGVSTQRWTLAFERGSYDLAVPEGTVTLGAALRAWLSRRDPGLAAAAAFRTYGAQDAFCAHLRQASRDSLSAWYADHPLPAPPRRRADAADKDATGRPASIAQCAACHAGEVAPRIPFADPAALAPLLLAGNYPRGRLLDEILFRLAAAAGADRMPRGINIDPEERRALEAYFVAVADRGRSD